MRSMTEDEQRVFLQWVSETAGARVTDLRWGVLITTVRTLEALVPGAMSVVGMKTRDLLVACLDEGALCVDSAIGMIVMDAYRNNSDKVSFTWPMMCRHPTFQHKMKFLTTTMTGDQAGKFRTGVSQTAAAAQWVCGADDEWWGMCSDHTFSVGSLDAWKAQMVTTHKLLGASLDFATKTVAASDRCGPPMLVHKANLVHALAALYLHEGGTIEPVVM